MNNVNQSKDAVVERIQAHQKYAAYEINDWIFKLCCPKIGDAILDIGCGTGKQLIPLSQIIGDTGSIWGVDISMKSLQSINTENSRAQVKLIHGPMENLSSLLPSNIQFDLILCCFALYYSQNLEQTLAVMKECLAPHGRLFVCGPAPENNAELLRLHLSAVPKDRRYRETVKNYHFMEDDLLSATKRHFDRVDQLSFINPMVFPSVEDVMRYWKAYRLFNPKYEKAFKGRVSSHFSKEGRFITRKVVAGFYIQ